MDEMDLYLKWTEEWGFDPKAIREACKETTKGAPTFAYLDKVLEGIHTRTGGKATTEKEMQQALIGLGYSCGSYGADGEFGDMTEMAVRAFQAGKGLKQTGKYDAETHAALMAALDRKSTDAEESEARAVQIEKGKKCYVRTGPGTEHKALGVAHSEERLKYLGKTENGWHQVAYKDKVAYVSGKYGKLVT